MSRRRSLPIVRYNRFIASSKRQLHVTHRQAQGLYRGFKVRLEKIPTARDVKAHPKIARQELRKLRELVAPRSQEGRGPSGAGAATGALGAVPAPSRGRAAFAHETEPQDIYDEGYDYDDFIDGDEDVYAEDEQAS